MKFQKFINYATSKGKLDSDGVFGYQCMDLYNIYCREVLGTQKGETGCASAKMIPFTENNTRFFEVYKNTPDFLPQTGDVFVITSGRYGHVGIVTSATLSRYNTLEQNNRGNQKVTQEVRRYSMGDLYFLRPKNQENIKAVETNNKGGYMARTYRNGRTLEPVYQDANCTIKIGTLNRFEQCTCIGESNGAYIVEYTIDGTNNKKVGYVKYHG